MRLLERLHHHRPQSTAVDAWVACVAPDRCVQFLAHGNITQRDVCRCGAIRETEMYGTFATVGDWTKLGPWLDC